VEESDKCTNKVFCFNITHFLDDFIIFVKFSLKKCETSKKWLWFRDCRDCCCHAHADRVALFWNIAGFAFSSDMLDFYFIGIALEELKLNLTASQVRC
jgi:hypothetical protein